MGTHPLTHRWGGGTRLTPEGHEDGEEDSGGVVEEVAGAGRGARRAHLPVAAGLVTQRAHGDVVSLVTHLHAGRKGAAQSHLADGQRPCRPTWTGASRSHVGWEKVLGVPAVVDMVWLISQLPPVPTSLFSIPGGLQGCVTGAATQGPQLGFTLCPPLKALMIFEQGPAF